MATIYRAKNGEHLSEGLQGSSVCDEAMIAAVADAKHLGEDVILEDDDGTWLVSPDGSREEFEWK